MMRTRQDINSPISDNEDEDDELEAFLQRFDLEKEYARHSNSSIHDILILSLCLL